MKYIFNSLFLASKVVMWPLSEGRKTWQEAGGGHTIRQSPALVQVPVGAKMQHRSRNSLAQNLLWLPIPWGSKTEVPHWEQKAIQNSARVCLYIHTYIYISCSLSFLLSVALTSSKRSPFLVLSTYFHV